MGKVLKGSPASLDRFTLAFPVYTAPQELPTHVEGDSFDYDFGALHADEQSEADAEADAAAQAALAVEAASAQAQELIAQATRDAETVVNDAHERAAQIVADATEQATSIGADARRGGHDDGYAAGLESAQAEMSAMLDTMRDLLASTRTKRHDVINSAEPELVRLAVAIAERVLHQQIALDNGVVVEMARAAITRIVDREKLTVRVNPADMERMREHRDNLLALGDVKTMRVIEDQRVDRGGVIIETDAGSIDAKISTQLAEVRKLLHIVDDVIPPPVVVASVPDPAYIEARAS